MEWKTKKHNMGGGDSIVPHGIWSCVLFWNENVISFYVSSNYTMSQHSGTDEGSLWFSAHSSLDVGYDNCLWLGWHQ